MSKRIGKTKAGVMIHTNSMRDDMGANGGSKTTDQGNKQANFKVDTRW